MSNFQKGQQQGIDEDELKAQFRPKELFSFNGFLARKGGPKSYTKEKRSAYHLNYLAILGGDVLRIAAAFLAVFFFFKGIFAITGSAAVYIAGIGAGILLFALEMRQWQNATGLMERWFFKNQMSRTHVVWAIVLSLITLGLSLWGLPHTVAELSPTVQRGDVALLDKDKETIELKNQIAASEKEAADFKGTGEWKGRLSASDRKTYNNLLLNAKELRDKLNDEHKRIRDENQKRMDAAEMGYMDQVALKMKKDNSYTTYLALILLLTEILFWVGFYHKERYEFFAYKEAERLGKIAMRQSVPHSINDLEELVKEQVKKTMNGNGVHANP
jgi:hypothetical protein